MRKRYLLAHLPDLPENPCPCGLSQRAFTDDADKTASFHYVKIKKDSERHYHKIMTEIYHVVKGSGIIELDDDRVAVSPGSTIMIKKGCVHRAVGDLEIINVAIPSFDPRDEYVVEQ